MRGERGRGLCNSFWHCCCFLFLDEGNIDSYLSTWLLRSDSPSFFTIFSSFLWFPSPYCSQSWLWRGTVSPTFASIIPSPPPPQHMNPPQDRNECEGQKLSGSSIGVEGLAHTRGRGAGRPVSGFACPPLPPERQTRRKAEKNVKEKSCQDEISVTDRVGGPAHVVGMLHCI